MRSRRTPFDPHGQPINEAFNRSRRCDRDLSEMLGLAKGMLCDGVVNEVEAKYLRDWGARHPDALFQWPVSLIFSRLQQFFLDGKINESERADLHDLLSQLVGGTASLLLGYEGASTLPLDNPAPALCWGPEVVYVFTGKFAYGTRTQCEHEVTRRGAVCENDVTRRTSFLVIGTFGSDDWAHSAYGRKIERAVELRESGVGLHIVGEDHWAAALTVNT